jgi:hypothetical protein
MERQQQKISALLESNVSTMVSSQDKIKIPASKFFTNINHHSYNKQLVWNRFALHTAGRYTLLQATHRRKVPWQISKMA